jgi:hypothetical protein
MTPLTNAERQALWRERQKAKVAQSNQSEQIRFENHKLRERIAELEQQVAALKDSPRYPQPRYLSELVDHYLSGKDPDDPDYPAVKDDVIHLYWFIVDAVAPLIDECRQQDPRVADDFALTLGLHPDPANGLTYRQFAEKVIEAGIDGEELEETFRRVAKPPKKALKMYKSRETPMNFGAAVMHRKVLKRLGLWHSLRNE